MLNYEGGKEGENINYVGQFEMNIKFSLALVGENLFSLRWSIRNRKNQINE